MAGYNFRRGRQMIVHDNRLNNPFTSPPTSLRPPAAENVWTVMGAEPAEHILGWTAQVAKGNSGSGKLNALHFMAHGFPGGIQLGRDNLSWSNVQLFQKLRGCISGAIVFFSCQVGAEQANHSPSYQLTFGNAVAVNAGTTVVACQLNQWYSFGSSTIDFGDFEGVVYVYNARGEGAQLQNYSSRSKVNLERLVFG
ncbi:MAG TPA: DUF4347 domain-containing protein [Polyangiaceae bacterium]|nr:DUF4347 domain-containing protein [Polyangiaceae bacterium]